MEISIGSMMSSLLMALILQIGSTHDLANNPPTVYQDQEGRRLILHWQPEGKNGKLVVQSYGGEVLEDEFGAEAVKDPDELWSFVSHWQKGMKPEAFTQPLKEQTFWSGGEKSIRIVPWESGVDSTMPVVKNDSSSLADDTKQVIVFEREGVTVSCTVVGRSVMDFGLSQKGKVFGEAEYYFQYAAE